MRQIGLLVLTVLVAVSCQSAVKWQKPNVAAAEQQRDEADCASLANRETTIPTAGAAGTTTGTPIASTQPRMRSYDARAFEECMKTRGYERAPAQ
jgi:hypothetical protein